MVPAAENIRPVVSVPVEAIYLSVGDSYTLSRATCTDARAARHRYCCMRG